MKTKIQKKKKKKNKKNNKEKREKNKSEFGFNDRQWGSVTSAKIGMQSLYVNDFVAHENTWQWKSIKNYSPPIQQKYHEKNKDCFLNSRGQKSISEFLKVPNFFFSSSLFGHIMSWENLIMGVIVKNGKMHQEISVELRSETSHLNDGLYKSAKKCKRNKKKTFSGSVLY